MGGEILGGVITSLLAGLVTGVGGFCLFLKSNYKKSEINFMLNTAAGIMLAAVFFSLLSPAIEGIGKFSSDAHTAGFWFSAAIFAGASFVWILNAILPHEHNVAGHHGTHIELSSAWLFVIAITIHKLPEGLAIGVAYGSNNAEAITIGVALQNIPEGLTIAMSLFAAGYSRLKAAICSTLTGLIQPVGALLGLAFIDFSDKLIPLGMAFAGGTLLFVVINEILPETYSLKKSQLSAFAVFLGFIVMSYICISLQ